MFRRMSIRVKLVTTFVLLTVLLIVTGGMSVLQMRSVNDAFQELIDHTIIGGVRALELKGEIQDYIYKVQAYLLDSDDQWYRGLEADRKSVTEAFSLLEGLSLTADQQAAYRRIVSEYALADRYLVDSVEAFRQGNWDAALAIFDDGEEARQTLFSSIEGQVLERRADREAGQEALNRRVASTEIFSIVVMLVSLVIAVILSIFFPPTISTPVMAMAAMTQRVAAGDLTVEEVQVRSHDEIGSMGQAFNGMIRNMREVIGQVTRSSDQLLSSSEEMAATAEEAATATNQIADVIQQVAQGTSDQSSSVEQTAQAIEELRQAIDQIAKGAVDQANEVQITIETVARMSKAVDEMVRNADSMTSAAAETAEIAREGGAVVQQTVRGMEEIHQATRATSARIHELGSHSVRVGEIVEVISDIADQTNLLALNAAIEAARAGEHGQGFAVVADEVRKLAERSAESAKEITHLIRTIQAGTDEAVSAMQSGSEEVESGMVLADRAGDALGRILASFDALNREIRSIAVGAEELRAGIDEVTAEVEKIASVTEENTAATEQMAAQSEQVMGAIENISSISEETAAAAEEVSASTEEVSASGEEMSHSAQSLAGMAEDLKSAVAQFRI